MIKDLLFAADLISVAANPSGTVEEHEMAAARFAVLAAHGAHTDALSLEGASAADIDLLSSHVCRWVLNEAKHVPGRESESRLPDQAVLQELFVAETDRVGRLLLIDAVVTHPETERKLAELDEQREPVPLEQLADTWPRNYLVELSRPDDETVDGQADSNLTELGMLLLQIATPAALAFLGGTVMTLRQRGRENHPLVEFVRTFVAGRDAELAQKLGIESPPDRFA